MPPYVSLLSAAVLKYGQRPLRYPGAASARTNACRRFVRLIRLSYHVPLSISNTRAITGSVKRMVSLWLLSAKRNSACSESASDG